MSCHSNIIGLDLSLSSTGIGVVDKDGNIINHSSVGKSIAKGDTNKLHLKMARWFMISNHICSVIEENDVKYVFIEDYAMGSFRKNGKTFQSSSKEKLAELHGVVISQIYARFKIIPSKIGVIEWKKYFFMKSGNFKKEHVVKEMKKIVKCSTIDEYEALAIAKAGRNKMYEIKAKIGLFE